MISARTTPRLAPLLVSSLTSLPLACAGDGEQADGSDDVANDTTDEGDGDGDACEALGSPIDGIPVYEPPPYAPEPQCASSWADDAPLREPVWSLSLHDTLGQQLVGSDYARSLDATPDGGVVVTLFAQSLWITADGSLGPVAEHGLDTSAVMVRQSDGHLLLASHGIGKVVVHEFDPEGVELGALDVPLEGQSSEPRALLPYADDQLIVVGKAFDDVEQSNEAFFARIDASSGAVLLRKATSLSEFGVPLAAIDRAGNLLFGADQLDIVDPDDGSVINSGLSFTNAGPLAAVGGEAGFGLIGTMTAGPTDVDSWIAEIDGSGATVWAQSHARVVGKWDQGNAITAMPDGGWAAVGTEGVWWWIEEQPYLQDSSPWVVRTDGQGQAIWAARMAVSSVGGGASITTTSDGDVVAAGVGRLDGAVVDPVDVPWIARWDD